MPTDLALKARVMDELAFEPAVNATSIGVGVDGGVVTLSGFVDSFAEKRAAERAVRRLKGVRALAMELQVRLPHGTWRADDQIARAAISALEWDVRLPHESMQVTVENGFVTLDGTVAWHHQREAAEEVVSRLTGVVHVINCIHVQPQPLSADVRGTIEAALTRNAQLDASGISVEVVGPRVFLRGAVDSWKQREIAERIVWDAPGVGAVENEIAVRIPAPAVA